ncbi:HAD-IIIC family phosphatase [Streptomyces lunaelactis]|uniref:HAD-IIIC family phosphatase n=1 Tax=Streptomyces lunaelactis TaxID=1535768 RepID=UPI0015856CAE|nr:HAD-IIIC family phosphatase [Streptomyces lunaelactis]NUK74088.1 HAD-IIIC family phosphatase [Streptomyces lunaelactis]NUK81130.1 HAD-IIIC family phosphatase [Streptomyces lunaelactis]
MSARGAAQQELRTLHEAGGLVDAYPQVAQLLARLDEGELDLAGRLLARLNPSDVLAAHPSTPAVRIAVTGRSTTAGLVPALTAQLARHGLLLIPYSGGNGGYVQDLADPASELYVHQPELTLCVLDPLTVWDRVRPPWQPYDVALEAERLRLLLAELAGTHAAHAPAGATFVLNTVPLLRRFTHQLTGLAQRAELGAVWREFNADLLRMCDPAAGVAVLDLEPLTSAGVRADDPRLGAYADAHCTAGLIAGYARESAHLARAQRGDAKKCLVLDLDGTLWDGILAEDGPERVRAARSLRAGAFAGFRRTVEQLASQGVLLAVCSKNDPEPVARALAAHPDWPLSSDDFVSVIADWGSKAEGIRKIAADLGISPSAVVFADDSAFEREAVRAGVPGAAVVPLDGEPAHHTERLLADGWFDVPSLTEEDRGRASRYREREQRELRQAASKDYASFLRSLDIAVDAGPAKAHELARIAQLSLRTNRFNLTGERLAGVEIQRLAEDPDALVLAVRAADRYGEDGVVGAVFARRDRAGLHLENMVVSCRVLGRGIENAVLAGLLHAARDAGLPAVHARWRQTPANEAQRAFCPAHGFETASETASETAASETASDTASETASATGGAIRYRHALERLPLVPSHVRLRLRLTHDRAQEVVEPCAPSSI